MFIVTSKTDINIQHFFSFFPHSVFEKHPYFSLMSLFVQITRCIHLDNCKFFRKVNEPQIHRLMDFSSQVTADFSVSYLRVTLKKKLSVMKWDVTFGRASSPRRRLRRMPERGVATRNRCLCSWAFKQAGIMKCTQHRLSDVQEWQLALEGHQGEIASGK